MIYLKSLRTCQNLPRCFKNTCHLSSSEVSAPSATTKDQILPYPSVSRSKQLIELPNPRAKILSLGQNLQHTLTSPITSLIDHRVAPPIQLDVRNLQRKKYDNPTEGNGARKCRRRNKSLLSARQCRFLFPPKFSGGAGDVPWTTAPDTASSDTATKTPPQARPARCRPGYTAPTLGHRPALPPGAHCE